VSKARFFVSFCSQCLATTKSISNTQTTSSHSASLKFSVLKPVFLNYVNISPNDVALCIGYKMFCVSSRNYSAVDIYKPADN